MRFSAPVSISFFYESWSNIESSHFPSFPRLRLCFFLCIQCILLLLLLQSLLCQFHHRYRSRKRCRCPDRCVCLSFVRPHFHLQCYPSLQCRRFRWSRLFVYRSFCMSFSFVWLVERFALRRLNHSFMLFCECPDSRGVVHRRGYHCVEKPKSMSKHVSSRCQSLYILVERGLSSPDTIYDFGRLLLLESYHLVQVFCTLFSC